MKPAERAGGMAPVEVTGVSTQGIRLFVREKEVFLPFEIFPWFREAPVNKILHVQMPSEDRIYWPDLDVNLEIDSIMYPDSYPLASGSLADPKDAD